jgi:predicted secreted protein
VNKELIIQCKKLVLNRNIQFNGTDVTVVIEYEEVQDNFHTVNASLGAKGLLRLEKKKFQ